MTATLLLGGLIGACIGLYGLLDTTAPFPFGLPALVVGGSLMLGGVALAGRRTTHTRYRPDRWMAAEWAVIGSAAASLALVVAGVALDPASLQVALAPIEWPRCRRCRRLGCWSRPFPPSWLPCHRSGRRRRRAGVPPGSRAWRRCARDRARSRRRDVRGRRPSGHPRRVARDRRGRAVPRRGPTGSGKSTLLRTINGLVPHFTGGTLAGRVAWADAIRGSTGRASSRISSASSGRIPSTAS